MAAKIEEEVKETASIEAPTPPVSSAVNDHSSAMNKYIEIEDLCFNYFTKRYANKYRLALSTVHRNHQSEALFHFSDFQELSAHLLIMLPLLF